MFQNKIKILVACHKPESVYQDNVYMPIHVGRSISIFKNEMADMVGDDSGENISQKNPLYCELTAQYWAWKNLNTEYIGLCHYRRYFEQKVTIDNVDSLLGTKYDALCVDKIYETYSVCTRVVTASSLEDFQIFMYSLKKISPDIFEYAKTFFKKNEVTPYNMFIMKKVLFDEFAEWQFAVLGEMEKYVKLSAYTRARRIYGYYAEMMLPLFLEFHNKKIRYSPCVNMVGEKVSKTITSVIYKYYKKILHRLIETPLLYDISAVVVGFKADGMDIGYIDKPNKL